MKKHSISSLILILFLTISSTLSAQRINEQLTNLDLETFVTLNNDTGSKTVNNLIPLDQINDLEGSALVYNEPMNVVIITKAGERKGYKNANVETLNGNIAISNNGNFYGAHQTIKPEYIKDAYFIISKEKVERFTFVSNPYKKKSLGLVRVLFESKDDNIMIVKQYESTFYKAKKAANSYDRSKPARIKTNERFFIVRKGQEAQEFKKTKDLFKLFEDSKSIKKRLKNEDLDINNEASYELIFSDQNLELL